MPRHGTAAARECLYVAFLTTRAGSRAFLSARANGFDVVSTRTIALAKLLASGSARGW